MAAQRKALKICTSSERDSEKNGFTRAVFPELSCGCQPCGKPNVSNDAQLHSGLHNAGLHTARLHSGLHCCIPFETPRTPAGPVSEVNQAALTEHHCGKRKEKKRSKNYMEASPSLLHPDLQCANTHPEDAGIPFLCLLTAGRTRRPSAGPSQNRLHAPCSQNEKQQCVK